jgi:hypothetical protein
MWVNDEQLYEHIDNSKTKNINSVRVRMAEWSKAPDSSLPRAWVSHPTSDNIYFFRFYQIFLCNKLKGNGPIRPNFVWQLGP